MEVTKNKVRFYLPVYASAEFEIDKPENWDDMTTQEQVEYFMEHGECLGSICHQCSDNFFTDFDITEDADRFIKDEIEYSKNTENGGE